MKINPWSSGPGVGGLWICEEDQHRIDRANGRMPPDDARRVYYRSIEGHPLVPGAWSGNPWEAPIVLLLLNPAYSKGFQSTYTDPTALKLMSDVASGNWSKDYPNAWLHPLMRKYEPWCASVPCGALHRQLVGEGMDPEEAWSLLSRKIAILELSAWVSSKWSTSAIVGTTSLSVHLANEAISDPNRLVLLGRGEGDWKTAGVYDADLLPLSRGVRSNQSRITQGNFPTAWARLQELLKSP